MDQPHGTATVTAPEKGAVFEAPDTAERELLYYWRHLLGSDRRTKLREIVELANERMAQRKELFAEAGIDRIAEGAANASRKRDASTTAEPGGALKQRSLLDDQEAL